MTPLRLAVLLSGSGTTLQNLIDRSRAGRRGPEALAKEPDPYTIAVAIGSKPDAYGLERAKRADIPAICIARKEFSTTDAYNEALWKEIRTHDVTHVVLAGFMHMLRVPDNFRHKIVNMHPALLPSFGGKGMYGIHVHEAVLAYGAKVTGCTVHFVDEQYDTGPIILQKIVTVREDDTAETLQARVQEAERKALPEALRYIAEERVTIEGRRVRIR